MTNQTFVVAGTSVSAKGIRKARFGNDLVSRIQKLKDNTDVNMIELPRPMTKVEAATYLLEKDVFRTSENRDALTKVVFRNVPKRKVQSVSNDPVNVEVSNVS